jgi:Tat protein translocase TatB subunit
MLGLGPGEILLVAVVVIVVVGPDRLPQFMRGAGRLYSQFRKAADEMRRSLVLEADRQDAESRYGEMQRRRKEALEKTPESPSSGAVPRNEPVFEDPLSVCEGEE